MSIANSVIPLSEEISMGCITPEKEKVEEVKNNDDVSLEVIGSNQKTVEQKAHILTTQWKITRSQWPGQRRYLHCKLKQPNRPEWSELLYKQQLHRLAPELQSFSSNLIPGHVPQIHQEAGPKSKAYVHAFA